MKRYAVPTLALLLVALGVGLRYAPGLAAGGPLSVVVVEETAERTPAQAAIYFAPELQPYRDKKLLRIIDKDSAGPDIGDVQWVLDAAKGKKLPVWCLRRGSRVTLVNPPADAKAAAALLKKYGG